VLLTRDDDRNVPIDERTAIANNNKADLFISLHANASMRKATSGATIFTRRSTGAAAQAAGYRSPRARAGVRRRAARHRDGAVGPRADPPTSIDRAASRICCSSC
jgi:N-acetylmuramoyl-L-alanine amidase